jgi:hypothetical protein
MRSRHIRLVAALALLLVPPIALAQGRRSGVASFRHAVPYDSNLVFTRLIYGSGLGGFGGGAWSHDYPAADKNLAGILDYISHVRVRLDGTNVLDLDDPEIFQNPILYVWEPGYWSIEASEAVRLREYLLKGGFVIFDDFEGPNHWENMTRQMKRALPDHDFIKLDESHTIFKSFYVISKLDVPHPSMNVVPGYWALFENNDPHGRMIALANHNSDIAEYWEWSAEGLYSQDRTGDAYRLGVNYYIYAMTH